MEAPLERDLAPGDVVAVAFPFSDMSGIKVRPALVAATGAYWGDLVLAQITTRQECGQFAVRLAPDDVSGSGLRRESHVRADMLFTANVSIVRRVVGTLCPERMQEFRQRMAELFSINAPAPEEGASPAP